MSVKVEGIRDLNEYLNKKLAVGIDRGLRLEIRIASLMIRNQYVRNLAIHRDTGALSESVEADSSDGWLSAEIGASAPQSLWIEFGTKRHPIRATNPTGHLAFFLPAVGTWVSPKEVDHPGTKAYLPLTKAYIEVMVPLDKFAKRLERRFEKI